MNQDFGYVQVNYFNHLGMVCSEGFDDKDAEVVCRENGYVTGFSYKHNTSSRVYRHNIRWLSNVMCKGTEDLFSQCGNLNWGQTGVCSQLNAAGVFCVRTAGKYLPKLLFVLSKTRVGYGIYIKRFIKYLSSSIGIFVHFDAECKCDIYTG